VGQLVNPPETPSILDAPPAIESIQSVAAPDTIVSAPTTLWLIRHAEVEERYQNVFGGRIDMDLSSRGRAQSEALGRYLQTKKVDALYASPMKRVQQTLAPWLAGGSIKPIVRPELREVDFGDWTGLHWTEVQAKYGISALAWLDQLECGGIPNAEDARTFRARVEPAMRELLRNQAGRHLAIACHGGVIRMLLSILLELPLAKMALFEIDYASVTQVLWTPAMARVQLANFVPWQEPTW
jgi:broad specificity phosphatase PhoE